MKDSNINTSNITKNGDISMYAHKFNDVIPVIVLSTQASATL